MDIASTEATEKTSSAIIVAVDISHGDYRASFYGSGPTLLEAAEEAAQQSTYSMGLFDITDRFYASRAKYRADLTDTLTQGGVYRGFGWCNFRRVVS